MARQLREDSERLMRGAIPDIPDGTYAAENLTDGYIDDPEPSRRDPKIAVTIKVSGDELTVDLTGTSPQVSDRPINMPFEGTVDVAIWLTLRSILLDSAVYGNTAGSPVRSPSWRRRARSPTRSFRRRRSPGRVREMRSPTPS